MRLQQKVHITTLDNGGSLSYDVYKPNIYLNEETLKLYGIKSSILEHRRFVATLEPTAVKTDEFGFWILNDNNFLLREITKREKQERSYGTFGEPPKTEDTELCDAMFASSHANAFFEKEGLIDKITFDIEKDEYEWLRSLPHDTVFRLSFEPIEEKAHSESPA